MVCMAVDSAGLEILDEQECGSLLADTEVGRVGVSIGALPAIFPVNYRFVNEELLFFTGEGTKLTAALSKAVVAFEADQVDPLTRTGWSVHVLGIAEVSQSAADQAAADLAGLEAWAPAERPYLVRIRPDWITGRRLPATSVIAGT